MAKARGYQLPPELAEFAARYWSDLSGAVASRMRRIGVPNGMIGIRYWGVDDGPMIRYDPSQLGGNIRRGFDGKPGINVDIALLDRDAPLVGDLPVWRNGSWKDRIDAVVAHEYTEVLAPDTGDFHLYAVANAEFTPLAITERARQILREYREAAGY